MMKLRLIISVLATLLLANRSFGWMRWEYEDEQIVQRSALIVVGKIDRNTIMFVDHPGNGSHHHTANLIISKILKGKLEEKQIEIVLRYGLTPVAAGEKITDGLTFRRPEAYQRTGKVRLVDTADVGMEYTCDDITQEQIWFLHPNEGPKQHNDPVPDSLGVRDPEDVQPASLSDYFSAYLDPNPQEKVRQHFLDQPEARTRAMRYLSACQLRKIAADPDLSNRAILSIPYFLTNQTGNYKPAPTEILEGCGKTGGAALEPVFQDWKYHNRRPAILQIWKKLHYSDAVPKIIQSVDRANNFFKSQLDHGRIQPGKWTQEADPNDYYSDTYYGIWLLTELGAKESHQTVAQSMDIWRTIDFSNSQIVGQCETFQKRLVRMTAPKP